MIVHLQVFRPREAIVRRVLNVEERGVYVLSFGSVDTFDALTDLSREGKGHPVGRA